MEKLRLTQFAAGGGCGCKLAPDVLATLLRQAGTFAAPPPELLVGAASADDAAVWRLSDDVALVATTDFFSPVVDDARDFGAIAATNALSDVFAMGARPLFALALAAMPADALPQDVIADIFAGGRAQCEAAGAVIAGGHSIDAKEPLYGLAVVGRAHPERILTNAGAQAGDVLLLGKPLGIGVLSAALRRGRLEDAAYAEMLAHTTQLNSAGAELAQVDGVHALTDVTGFGLLGHLAEMCRASGVGAQVRLADVPMIAAALELAKDGVATGASARNWRSLGDILPDDAAALNDWQRTMLTDPQTSGGLLAACQPEAEAAAQAVFARHGQRAAVIGEVTDSGRVRVVC